MIKIINSSVNLPLSFPVVLLLNHGPFLPLRDIFKSERRHRQAAYYKYTRILHHHHHLSTMSPIPHCCWIAIQRAKIERTHKARPDAPSLKQWTTLGSSPLRRLVQLPCPSSIVQLTISTFPSSNRFLSINFVHNFIRVTIFGKLLSPMQTLQISF